MALRIRPSYPYRRGGYGGQQSTGDFQAGWNIGSEIGKGLGGLAGAIKQAQQQSAQDAAANALMGRQAQSQMPAAQDLGTLPEDTGSLASAVQQPITLPDTSGTGPTVGDLTPTGGMAEYKTRQAFQQDQLTEELNRAKVASQLALAAKRSAPVPGARTVTGGGSASAWIGGGGQGGQPQLGGGRGGKPAPYQAGSSDVENDPTSDDPTKIAADFDATYGQKGLYGKFNANLGSIQPDDKGNYVLTDPKSGATIATVPGTDAPMWIKRINAARNKQGLPPIANPLPGSSLTSTAPKGSAQNPYVVNSNLDLRAAPYDSYVSRNGQVFQKTRKAPAQ